MESIVNQLANLFYIGFGLPFAVCLVIGFLSIVYIIKEG